MKQKTKQFFSLVLIALLSGCTTTLKVTKLDPATGRFPTETKISADGIVISEKVDISKYKGLVYIRPDGEQTKYVDFAKESIENIGFFDEVALKGDMEALLLQSGNVDQVSSISDLIGLHHAQKVLGDFLIVDFATDWEGGYNYMAFIKAIDPKHGKVLFHAKIEAFNWSGLDQPLFFPIFNAFIDWIDQNK